MQSLGLPRVGTVGKSILVLGEGEDFSSKIACCAAFGSREETPARFIC